ncbi:MAG: DUF2784 family protein [Sphingobacteriales bacterium]|nr:DUF2784 family protein [Sphingobacteriales bacterium]
MYSFLNIFFFVFHTVFTLFNMVGWIFPKTRKLNLFTLLITAFSWFVVGLWKGIGFCYCTQWHWQVRERLGLHDQTRSYIHFLFVKLTGLNLNVSLVETATVAVFAMSFILSVWLNIRDWRRKKLNR